MILDKGIVGINWTLISFVLFKKIRQKIQIPNVIVEFLIFLWLSKYFEFGEPNMIRKEVYYLING